MKQILVHKSDSFEGSFACEHGRETPDISMEVYLIYVCLNVYLWKEVSSCEDESKWKLILG